MASSTIPASGGGGLAPKYVKYTSSGTFTLPDGYGAAKPLLITIQIIGGGGGGRMVASNTLTAGYRVGMFQYYGSFFRNITPVTPGSTVLSTGAGGSGGIAATQMYLTSNLTITVGAAGARIQPVYDTAASGEINPGGTGNNNAAANPNNSYAVFSNVASGTGGTTTAGSVQATGGSGGTSSTQQYGIRIDNVSNSNTLTAGYPERNANGATVGTGGTPAGTNGEATPLLGTLAGGSTNATPIRGSFGIGGISTDGTTSTGVEGTGGGINSAGASGAVIITYWA
jgi:hypothetical protein